MLESHWKSRDFCTIAPSARSARALLGGALQLVFVSKLSSTKQQWLCMHSLSKQVPIQEYLKKIKIFPVHAWDLPVLLMNVMNVFKGTLTLSLSSFPLPPLQGFSFISELTYHKFTTFTVSVCLHARRGFSYLQPTLKYLIPPYWPPLRPTLATITSPVPFSALHTTNRIARASNFYFSLFCKFFFHQFFCLLTSIESDLTDTLLLLSEQKMSSVQVLFPLNFFFFLNSLSLSQTYTEIQSIFNLVLAPPN